MTEFEQLICSGPMQPPNLYRRAMSRAGKALNGLRLLYCKPGDLIGPVAEAAGLPSRPKAAARLFDGLVAPDLARPIPSTASDRVRAARGTRGTGREQRQA